LGGNTRSTLDQKEKTTMKRAIAVFVGLVGVMALPMVATAHNAGHLFLPDGRCQLLGSFRDAPLVGQDKTQLDLVPQTPNPPFDEYGVSFVGFGKGTPIFPGGNCNVGAPAVDGLADASGIPTFAEVSYE
jgi:hypothetical protein